MKRSENTCVLDSTIPIDIPVTEDADGEKVYSNYTLKLMAKRSQVPVPEVAPAMTSSDVMIDIDKLNSIIDKYVVEFSHEYRELILDGVRKRMSEKYESIILTMEKEVKEAVEVEFQKKIKAITEKEVVANKYKVMVIGLLQSQAAIVEKEYGAVLNILFIRKEENISRINDNQNGCDYVLAMKKFVSHSITNAVKNHEGYKLIVGGIDALEQALLEIACN